MKPAHEFERQVALEEQYADWREDRQRFQFVRPGEAFATFPGGPHIGATLPPHPESEQAKREKESK